MTTQWKSLTTLSAVLLFTGACGEKPMAYGDANSVIAVMSGERWEEVSEEVYGVLESTITTVREEKTFTVTYQEPGAQFWDRLRRFRQMLVVGTRTDPWVQEALAEARDPVNEGDMVQIYNVWSRGQTVTLVLLEDGWGADELRPFLPRVQGMLDDQFRAYSRNRMYISGADTALADTLSLRAGFTMLFPDVYRWRVLGDSVYVFRNDNPDPSELIREINVTWRTPATDVLDRSRVLDWRQSLVAAFYPEPQAMDLERVRERSFDFMGHPAYELRAEWTNPPERNWPAGGPFITRVVTCDAQDRTYLLDAWLYAPGREKYEYMIQLETLLDSFRCDT